MRARTVAEAAETGFLVLIATLIYEAFSPSPARYAAGVIVGFALGTLVAPLIRRR